MKSINIANEKDRDAVVGFESNLQESGVHYVLKKGGKPNNIKLLKNTLENDTEALITRYGSLEGLGKAIIEEDPDIDIEKAGMILQTLKSVYVDKKNDLIYNVHLEEISKAPDGSEKDRKPYIAAEGNVNCEFPLKWTGKLISKEEAVKKFVFSRKYQIKHVNSLTFDFLFDMAKSLDEKKSMMLIGGGAKGNAPLVFFHGGVSYRGFLEGRVKESSYCLILHLTNLEIKEIQA
ncbi:MAG: hypothetical protein JXB88_15140 [Spirochaetales bacterium]|nr:hypothetical protein [Spirochaetales bacterium]